MTELMVAALRDAARQLAAAAAGALAQNDNQ